MSCEEKARLVEEHHLKALAYARAARALNRSRGTSSAVEYSRLRVAAANAKAKSAEARLAIMQHIEDHGC